MNTPQLIRVNTPENIEALKDPGFAIDFALKELEQFDMPLFLRDQREGKDLSVWLRALDQDREEAGFDPFSGYWKS